MVALNHSSSLPSVGSVQGCLNGLRRRDFRCCLAELEGGGGGASIIPRKLSVCPVIKLRVAASFLSGGFSLPLHSTIQFPPGALRASQTSQQRRKGRACDTFAPSRGTWSSNRRWQAQGPATIYEVSKYLLCAYSVLGTFQGRATIHSCAIPNPWGALFILWAHLSDTFTGAGCWRCHGELDWPGPEPHGR